MSSAMTGEANLGGRPSKFQPHFSDQARKLAALGAIDVEIAAFFDVALSTVSLWKVTHAEFAAALRLGKEVADERVTNALFSRAVGYSYDSEKIVTSCGSVFREPIVEHTPPDTTAQIFWLKNRRPDLWRAATDASEPGASSADILAKIKADAPILRPDEPGPANPIL